MTSIRAIDVSQLSAPALRLAQAEQFFTLFNQASRPGGDCWFDMAMHFDAFLFCFVSIEEMVPAEIKVRLRSVGSFKFFKALRNITAHHSVIAGASPAAKFPRPVVRYIPDSLGASEMEPVEFKLKPDRLRIIFEEILNVRESEKWTIEAARSFLDDLEAAGRPIFIRQLMELAIAEMRPHVT